MKRVTIKEVAKHANVSIATVSRVVNNIGTVTEANRKKVKQSIEELNYFSNTAASNLKKNSSNVIGIVIPTVMNEFFMEFIKGIEDGFEYSEYVFYIASSDDTPKKEEAILRKLFESNAEAVVLATIGNNEAFVSELLQMKMNIISVDRRIEIEQELDFIGENNYESAYKLATKFLETVDLKDIVVLGGYEELSIGSERTDGALKALAEKAMHYEYYNGDYNETTAQKLFKEISAKYPEGCGIISLNNTMTAGLIKGIHEKNGQVNTMRYPVASYGQITFQPIFNKNIKVSVHQYPYQIGTEVAQLLQEKINGKRKSVTKLIENQIDSEGS